MKAFVSSPISGMKPLREAAREAVTTVRFQPVMAEDFGARPDTPQVACLTELRQSDVVVLVLGARYGDVQPSGLSATHEEWREARDRKPVLVFVEEGVDRESKQAAFVEEVQGWAKGRFRAGFRSPADLRLAIGQALVDYERTVAVSPVDETQMIARAFAMIGTGRRADSSGGPSLSVVVAGGPKQQILRPAEIEAPALSEALNQAALFGETRVFDRGRGVQTDIENAALVLKQDGGFRIQLEEAGDLLVTLSLVRPRGHAAIPAIVEDEVAQALGSALAYTDGVLERLDPTQRLTRLVVAARIAGGEYNPWLTNAELLRSDGSYTMGWGTPERTPVHVVVPRAALRLDKVRLVEDLVVPLRRQWKPVSRG